MRQLAAMGALLFLVLAEAFSPIPVSADIVQSVADTETTADAQFSGGWTQFLGNGLGGTITEITFPIDWFTSSGAGTDRVGAIFVGCDDPLYASCGSIQFTATTYAAATGPGTVVINTETQGSTLGVNMDPGQYYKMSLVRFFGPNFNQDIKFKVFGSATDTYPRGNTDAPGLADMAFSLKGVSHVGTTTPPTGVLIQHLEGGSIIAAPNYLPGNIPSGVGIPHTLINSLAAGVYYAVVFFEGLPGCPSSNYSINAFIPGAYWGYDVEPNPFTGRGQSTSAGGCMQQFRIDPSKTDPWLWGALDPNTSANAIGDSNQVPAFAICADAASCDTLAPTSTPTGASNVLFLPGIEGSRLYETSSNGEEKIWEPSILTRADDLSLDSTGRSQRGDIYTRDVLDTPYGTDIYGSFLANLEQEKTNHVINDWEAIPYDWRLSLDDLLTYGSKTADGISYSNALATSSPYIIQEVRRLAATSPTHKVTIVAHSNGGLVAKQLVTVLGPQASSLIDQVILVASPQAGTPQAIAGLLHGQDSGLPSYFPIIFPASAARKLGNNSPTLYNLIPSANYFTYVDTPVITIDPVTLPDWVTKYGDTIHSEERLRNFLTDTYQRVSIDSTNLESPVTLNGSILDTAQSVHANLDAWSPPPGIRVTQIAGWGIPKTLSSIRYEKRGGVVHMSPTFVIDGDGTVVTPSALWTSAESMVTNYWVNLKKYNDDHENAFQQLTTFWDKNHANILSIPEVDTFINNLITATSSPSPAYISNTQPIDSGKRLQYALHSPLNLNLYDDQGRHTGLSTTTGKLEEQIPGTYYVEIGEAKYIFADEIAAQHIHMYGYGTGTFTLNVNEYEGNTLLASTTFRDIPTTASTSAVLTISNDLSTVSPLIVDENGDGNTDLNLIPKLNDTVTVPPFTYRWDGFLQPINDTAHQVGQSLSVFKAGSTVPVKFQLKKTDGTPIQATTTPIWLTPQKGVAMSAPVGESIYSDPGTTGSVFKWDPAAQQYLYNWSTKGLAAGYWYRIYVKLDDGNTYSVTIGLK
jgi:pimeloyl-ACP methyl ester carboxylesterase